MSKTVLAWHFVGDTLRGGRPVPADGEVLKQAGKIVPCENGLHASELLIDALRYASADTICRVECGGTIQYHGVPIDKLACSQRVILWRIDGKRVFRAFARRCALDVAHLWEMPGVVRRYLETGEEALRDAAWAAASAAAWAAASAAAWDAAWDAAWAAQNATLTAMVIAAHEGRTP